MPAANMEACKTLAAAGISGAYATVGVPTTHLVRTILITNPTQGDLWVTWDNSIDMIPVKAGSFVLFDVTANMSGVGEDSYFLPKGTQFYTRQITAPVDSSLYISCLY